MKQTCTFKSTGVEILIEEDSIEFDALKFIAGGQATITKLANHLSISLGEKVSNRTAHQIVRNLRELGSPIVGDSSGIRIAYSKDDIIEFAGRLEHKAKSDIASMMYLRKTMLSMIRTQVPSLFDSLTPML